MGRILVVDDEEKIRIIFRHLLEKEGFEVAEAETADEANEILKTNNIALVLLDIKMAQVKGDVLFEVIRCFHERLRIIITSVYPLEEQIRMIPEADGYYDKSQGTKILLEEIQRVLGIKDCLIEPNRLT